MQFQIGSSKLSMEAENVYRSFKQYFHGSYFRRYIINIIWLILINLVFTEISKWHIVGFQLIKTEQLQTILFMSDEV